MAISHVTDHVDQALARLTSQFKGKPNIEALITSLVEPIQRLEDAAWGVFEQQLDVNAAEGVQLDRIGALVGEERGGKADADYRRYLIARISTNRSRGTAANLINITELIINDDALELVLEPGYPAALSVHVQMVVLTEEVALTLLSFLLAAKAAGVRLLVVWWPTVEAEMFTFAVAAFLDGALVGAETTIDVVSTDGIPSSGTLRLSEGTADEEDVTYTGITPTSFTGCSAVVNTHEDGAVASWVEAPGLGLGDSSDATVGGELAGVEE